MLPDTTILSVEGYKTDLIGQFRDMIETATTLALEAAPIKDDSSPRINLALELSSPNLYHGVLYVKQNLNADQPGNETDQWIRELGFNPTYGLRLGGELPSFRFGLRDNSIIRSYFDGNKLVRRELDFEEIDALVTYMRSPALENDKMKIFTRITDEDMSITREGAPV